MRTNRSLALLFSLGVAAILTIAGCAKKEAPAAAAAPAEAPTPAGGGKIPITTTSPEARSEFLQGRELFDKLQFTDAAEDFRKAVAADPNFAWAELFLAITSPTGTDFFEHLNKAVVLADKASNGEKLLILATQAGANGDITKQKEDLDELVAAYPYDERAHFALAGWYFGQQNYQQAIDHYRRATELDPNYSSAFNLLGYAYRQSGDYPGAEKAFQHYVALIPKDPNPYDSYAELLLKMGRFDDAIVQYRKALEIDPSFINAYQGIAMAQLYAGKAGEAAKELDNVPKRARTDAERRTGMFALTIVNIDSGRLAKALEEVRKQYELGVKTNDVPAMAFDEGLKGNILLEMGKPDQAKAAFENGLKIVEGSNLSQDIKDNAKVVVHYNLARVAVAKKDFAGAKREADEFRKGAQGSKNPNQVKNAHELDGIIALAEKSWDKAISELEQAAYQQNPQDLYRLCQAYQGKGDAAKAKEYCQKAADFNSLPNQNYAFVRAKAKAAAAKG
jgi:tetratricopeptide (TPR) repeat protein